MTPLGGIFLAIFLIIGFFRPKRFIWCAAIAAPFNDSAMVAAGSISISPYYVALIIMAMQTAAGVLTGGANIRIKKDFQSPLLWVLFFFFYCAVVTSVGPSIFHGYGVYAASIGLDEQVGSLASLEYNQSNLAQLAYLGLNVLLFVFILRHGIERRMIAVALIIGLALSLLKAVMDVVHVPWPSEFFDNGPRNFYAVPVSITTGARLRGIFSEPSHLGAFSVAAIGFFAACFLADKRRSEKIKDLAGLAMALACVILCASATAAIGLVLVGIVAVVVYCWRNFGPSKLKKVRWYILPLMLIAVLVVIGGLELLKSLTLDVVQSRLETDSYTNRSAADLNAFELALQTNGFGVGLGSNRASSLGALLVSNIGFIGVLIFAYIVFKGLRGAYRVERIRPVVWAHIAALACGFVSYADFVSPILWLSLFTSLYYGQKFNLGSKPASRKSSGQLLLSDRRT